MSMIAFAAPILPGKEEQWRKFMTELQGSRYEDFKASRERYGVHERTFMQHTPMGDIVLITLEGNDPMGSFMEFFKAQDPFAQWFRQQVVDVHGIDLYKGLPGEPPEFMIDSRDRQTQRRAA